LTLDLGAERAGQERRLSPREQERFQANLLPYLDAAYNLARYLLHDVHEAEDAVQESCLRAIRHFEGFRGTDGRAWLLRIVRNTCFTWLRLRRGGGSLAEFDESLHTPEDEASGPAADLARTVAAESVREGLARLPPVFREVIVLRELEGLSYKEIAQVVAIPIGTVMSRLARGRRDLMLILEAKPKGER